MNDIVFIFEDEQDLWSPDLQKDIKSGDIVVLFAGSKNQDLLTKDTIQVIASSKQAGAKFVPVNTQAAYRENGSRRITAVEKFISNQILELEASLPDPTKYRLILWKRGDFYINKVRKYASSFRSVVHRNENGETEEVWQDGGLVPIEKYTPSPSKQNNCQKKEQDAEKTESVAPQKQTDDVFSISPDHKPIDNNKKVAYKNESSKQHTSLDQDNSASTEQPDPPKPSKSVKSNNEASDRSKENDVPVDGKEKNPEPISVSEPVIENKQDAKHKRDVLKNTPSAEGIVKRVFGKKEEAVHQDKGHSENVDISKDSPVQPEPEESSIPDIAQTEAGEKTDIDRSDSHGQKDKKKKEKRRSVSSADPMSLLSHFGKRKKRTSKEKDARNTASTPEEETKDVPGAQSNASTAVNLEKEPVQSPSQTSIPSDDIDTYQGLKDAKAAIEYYLHKRFEARLSASMPDEFLLKEDEVMDVLFLLLKTENIQDFLDSWLAMSNRTVHDNIGMTESVYDQLYEEAKYYYTVIRLLYDLDPYDKSN